MAFSVSVLAGCSGSSSGGGHSGEGARPALTLSATPTAVEDGGVSTVSWRASNAGACTASGGWNGSREPSGSETVGPLYDDTEFMLSCSGEDGGITRRVIVQVDGGSGPALSLRASPHQVPTGGASTLSWSAEDATDCTASGGWSGARARSGTFAIADLMQTTSFSLSCSGPSGNALATVTVEVLDRTLRWRPPTRNVDGTPLSELSGYRIYWGAESGSYGDPVTIDDPDATQWEIDFAAGTYYFALTAVAPDGSESEHSNEVIKRVL